MIVLFLLCVCLLCLPQPGLAAGSFPYVLQWKRLVGETLQGTVALRDSAVFIGGGDGRMLVVRQRDGVRIWQQRGSGPIRRAPAFAADELIFADAWGRVRAVEWRTGEERWAAQRLGWGDAEIAVQDSLVYISSLDGWLYALHRGDGRQVWRVHTGAGIAVRPWVQDKRLYAGTRDGWVLVVEASSGAHLQRLDAGSRATVGLLIAGKQLLVAGDDGYVRAYDRKKLILRWQRRLGAQVLATPLAVSGRLVCAADNGWAYGLRLKDGQVDWKQALDGKPLGGPVLGPQGMVLIGTETGRVLALEPERGEIAWDEQLVEEGGVRLHAAGEWLYASAGDGYLYAFARSPSLGAKGAVRWEDWWEVFSSGRKTGYVHQVAQETRFAGRPALRLDEESVEWHSGFRRTTSQILVDPAYRPLAFEQRTVEGSQVVEVEGTWTGDSLYLEQRLAGPALQETLAVGKDVALPEVVLLKLAREKQATSGRQDSARVFDYAGLKPRWLRFSCGQVEETPAGRALPVRMRYAVPLLEEVEILTWIDAEGREVRTQVPLLGIERVRVSAEQARTWVPPGTPRELHLNHPVEDPGKVEEMVLALPPHLRDPRRLVVEDERQQLRIEANGETRLIVRRAAYDGRDALKLPIRKPEVAPYLEPSLHIQAEDERVQALARRLRGDEDDSWKVALRLRQWVYDHMIPRDTNVRFKSTLEVLEDMEGTCSEYAVLFMALCRAAGVPARACVGFLASGTGELVLHIWTQVFVGRWVDMDPSWPESAVGAAHIKTGQGRLKGADIQRLNLPLQLFIAQVDTLSLLEYTAGDRRFIGTAEELFVQAREAEGGFRDERAQELYHQLLLLPWNLRSGPAHVAIARYRLQRGELGETAWACERVLRLDPAGQAADDALFYLSRVAEEREETEKAIAHLERLAAEFPDSDLADDALGRLGELHERTQGCRAAARYYERVREEYSQSGWAAVAESALARCRRKTGTERGRDEPASGGGKTGDKVDGNQ